MLKDVAPFKLDDNRLFKTGTIQVLLKPVVESEVILLVQPGMMKANFDAMYLIQDFI